MVTERCRCLRASVCAFLFAVNYFRALGSMSYFWFNDDLSPRTLQWKGLNLYSRGRVLKIASFVGPVILRVGTFWNTHQCLCSRLGDLGRGGHDLPGYIWAPRILRILGLLNRSSFSRKIHCIIPGDLQYVASPISQGFTE